MTDQQRLDAILGMLAEIREQLASALTTQGAHTQTLADHETRIRASEGRRWPLPSLSIVIAASALIIAAVGVWTGRG